MNEKILRTYLSKTESFEGGLAPENPARDLEKFGELETLVESSFAAEPQETSEKPTASGASAATPAFTAGFATPSSRSFTQALRARAQARASFSRSSIIKKNKPTP